MQAGVAATLAGLIFVAVSLNLEKILAYGVVGRAAEAMVLLAGVLLIASVALAPGQSDRILGEELLAISAPLWLVPVVIQCVHLRRRGRHNWWWLAMRFAICQLATVPFLICGVWLLNGAPGALYWLIPGCAFSMVGGLTSVWVLLIEILR